LPRKRRLHQVLDHGAGEQAFERSFVGRVGNDEYAVAIPSRQQVVQEVARGIDDIAIALAAGKRIVNVPLKLSRDTTARCTNGLMAADGLMAAGQQRYGAVDVHYPATGGATAALIIAREQTFAQIKEEVVVRLEHVQPYQPGRFYLRELPPIAAVLAATRRLDLLVIDGYVDLDPAGTPGLGFHVYKHSGIPVIGVAKAEFRTATHSIPVTRGTATKPLFVTAAGLPNDEAAALVKAMSGPYRLPDALRLADSLART
jgi:deoxyribonuclease V